MYIRSVPSTEASVANDCQSNNGSGCQPESFISSNTAVCIANAYELDPGLLPWSVTLTYHREFRRVVWTVRTVLHDGPLTRSGRIMVVDATEGALLHDFDYAAS